MTDHGNQRSVIRATWLVSALAGAVTSVGIETVLTIMRRLDPAPANLSNQPALVIASFLLCGAVIGIQLRSARRRHGVSVWAALPSFLVSLGGVAVGMAGWVLAEGLLTGAENGMDLLNIPFMWAHGTIPLIVGMVIGNFVQPLVRSRG